MHKDIDILKIFEQDNMIFSTLFMIMTGIGIIISVISTAITFACINRKKTFYKTTSENKVDGKRSLKL